MKLSERAMLATVHIGLWTGQLVDREVTEEVAERHNSDRKESGRYTKSLVAPKFLTKVRGAASVASATHKMLTLPWTDDGTRILATAGHAHYTQSMRTARLKFEASRDEFITNFQSVIDEARDRLKTMFNVEDYPEPSTLKNRFYLDSEISAIAEAGDFRAKLTDASVKAIAKDIERRTEERLKQATNDVFLRIADATGKMVEKLRSYEPAVGGENAKNTFRDSLVFNNKTLADLLPSLNIMEDQRLVDLQQQLEAKLLEHSPEVLRVDPKVRSATARDAEAILKKVKSFMA